MFRSSTPYLENTPLSMWDGFPIFLSIFGSCVVNLSTRLINRFPNWSGYFLIICTIFYNSYILFKMLSLPMIKQWMNIFISLFVSAGIFASLFQLFPISSLYRLIIPLVILAALIPALIFLHRFLKKKVMQIDITKDHITKEYQALRYIRIHVAFKSEEFVSFKFTKQMNHINTNKIISQVAQVISFFPSESQNLTFYISLLTKNSTLSFHQRFLLFQLRQVHVLRQSNTSKQLNEDLADIAKVTNRAINSFQQFLIRMIDERQALTIDSLRILAKINRNTNTICHEGMARYPNNSRLLFIFSRYLIECQTDFKEGVFFYHEGLMIERGKRAIIDLAFQSMVNLFPVYLWKKILNYKGQNILHRKHSKSGSSMSVDSVTNGRSNKISESDFESNEKVASNVMENPKLRFALRKSVNNMHSTGISMLTFSTIFRFLCSFIICVVMLYVAPEFLRTRSNNFKTISQINVFRKTLDLCLFRTAKLWSFNLNLAPKEDNISTFLGSTITLKDYNNLTYDPYFELFTNVIHSINASEELGKLLIEIKYKSFANLFDKSGEIGNKSQTDLLHVKNISFCNNRRHKIYQSTTSLRYFSLYILNQVVRVSTLNKIIRIQLTGSILKVFVKLF
ncbi:hypothetical protein M9Y10_032443 [Tritrichomonas musculus]|uniref:RGS domain-containing protein n=1 Tax=Tritrichomonas musculus TaxID=1915356 RepID=A0ABR2GZ81_9EUKA